jgi:predicted ABC-type ATPase
MTKWLVLVAGPNGAGKSTFVSTGVLHKTVATPEDQPFEILNPDAKARELSAGAQVTQELNIVAANAVEAALYRAIEAGRSIGVETVLSSSKYRALVDQALASGYLILLHYVVLARPDLHVGRVAQRVAQGGHGIPTQKIEDRYSRSLQQLPWFAAKASRAFIWDNSKLALHAPVAELIAEKDSTGWIVHNAFEWMHPDVSLALRRLIADES